MIHLIKNKRKLFIITGILAVSIMSVSCSQKDELLESETQVNLTQLEETQSEETQSEEMQLEETQSEEMQSEKVELEETQSQTEETQPVQTQTEEMQIQQSALITPKTTMAVYDGVKEDAFFEKSVFVGDSVMMGFRNYLLKQPEGFLGSPEFLVSGSYSIRMALNPVSEKTIHPIYQGAQHMIWDSMAMMGVEKAFLFFGLNDIGMLSVNTTYENYLKLFDEIYAVNPDISIYVISTTNIYRGSEKSSLNNENVRLLNQKMEEYCKTSREEYIDIANYLIDEEGYLKPEYCSDEYVHQTNAAYEIWVQVLREFASEHMQTKENIEQSTEEMQTENSATQSQTELESEQKN